MLDIRRAGCAVPRLTRVVPYETPGYTRRIAGRGMSYRDPSGALVPASERARLDALVIPPAWTRVWIAASPTAHIQAVGEDAAGRRQYLYHPQWRVEHDRVKFDRMTDLAAALPAARRRVTRELRDPQASRERVLAAAFRILDTVAIRVGGDEYVASSGARGVSTLLGRHVKVDEPRVRFSFPAKGGRRAVVVVDDVDLARAISELRRGDAARLLAYPSARGRRPVRASEINDYVCDRTGGPFTAKDFRTLRGTIVAAQSLAAADASTTRSRSRAVVAAVAAAAEALGNTPTVAKASYIDPRVVERFHAGVVIDTTISPESALLGLLREGDD